MRECFLSTGEEVEPLIDNVQYETKICPNPPLVSPEGKGYARCQILARKNILKINNMHLFLLFSEIMTIV